LLSTLHRKTLFTTCEVGPVWYTRAYLDHYWSQRFRTQYFNNINAKSVLVTSNLRRALIHKVNNKK